MDEIGPTLEGEAVRLRVLEPSEAAEWLAGEDGEQLHWFEMPAATIDDVGRAITRWRAGWTGGGPLHQWAIRTAADDRLAGGVELLVLEGRRARLSYVVFPAFRRQGLASEAAGLAIAWAFAHLDVDAVVADVDRRNVASLGVVRAAGFTLDGPTDPADPTSPMRRYVRPRA